MGFFSGGHKVYTSASAIQLITENNQLPHTVRASLIKSILTKRNIPGGLEEDILNGPPTNLRKLYSQAKRGRYYYGLPTSSLTQYSLSSDQFVDYLNIHYPGYEIRYELYGDYNTIHYGFKEVTDKTNYDFSTNKLTLDGLDYYVGYVIALINTDVPDSGDVTSPNVFEVGDPNYYINLDKNAVLGTDPYRDHFIAGLVSEYSEDYLLTNEYPDSFKIEFDYKETSNPISKDPIKQCTIIQAQPFDFYKKYFQAKLYNSSTSDTVLFSYDTDSKTNPALDVLIDNTKTADDAAEFMPFLHFRNNFEYINNYVGNETNNENNFGLPSLDDTLPGYDYSSPSSPSADIPEWLRSTRRAFRLLGTDLDDYIEKFDTNDGIDTVEQGMLGFFVKLNTDNKYLVKYLYHFFDWFSTLADFEIKDSIAISANPYKEIYDEIDGYKTVLSVNKFIPQLYRRNTLNIHDNLFSMDFICDGIGIQTKTGVLPNSKEYDSLVGSVTRDLIFNYSDGSGPTSKTVSVTLNGVVYRKQITDTTYREIFVANPESSYKAKKNVRGLLHDADEATTNVVVPIALNIVNDRTFFKFIDREKVMFAGIHCLMTTYKRVKKPGIWMKVLGYVIMAAGVVASFFVGPEAALLTAITVDAILAIAVAVVESIIIGLAIQFAIQAIAQLIGPEAAFALAIAAMVIGAGMTASGNSFMGLTGSDFIQVANGLEKETIKLQQDEIRSSNTKLEEATKTYTKKLKEIEEIKDSLLAADNLLDPFIFINLKNQYNAYETADEYLVRLKGLNNPGVISLDLIENYVELSLQLPKKINKNNNIKEDSNA